MAESEITNIEEQIRRGVADAGLLIEQKNYNMSMIKCRQVLELMVNCLCENASASGEDLASSIDALYQNECIRKASRDHYHKIRMLGNQAVHEGNDNAYDAHQAHQLLSREARVFAKDYQPKQGNPREGSGSRPAKASAKKAPAGRDSNGSRASRSRRRQPSRGVSLSSMGFVRAGMIVLVIAVIALAVRVLSPKPSAPQEETPGTFAASGVFENFPTSMPPLVETMADTTPTPIYKTSDVLNVRSEPSTAGSKLGVLEPGTIVDYVEHYDDEWVIINYNGTKAYISSQYLVHD